MTKENKENDTDMLINLIQILNTKEKLANVVKDYNYLTKLLTVLVVVVPASKFTDWMSKPKKCLIWG